MGVRPGERGDPNKRGNSRRWIIREVENSLRRLQTDWIDLYQIHRPEPWDRRRGRRSAALTDLQRQGKIRSSALRPSRRTRSSRRNGSLSAAAPALRHRAAPVFDAWCAASRPMCCPWRRSIGMGVIPWSPARQAAG